MFLSNLFLLIVIGLCLYLIYLIRLNKEIVQERIIERVENISITKESPMFKAEGDHDFSSVLLFHKTRGFVGSFAVNHPYVLEHETNSDYEVKWPDGRLKH